MPPVFQLVEEKKMRKSKKAAKKTKKAARVKATATYQAKGTKKHNLHVLVLAAKFAQVKSIARKKKYTITGAVDRALDLLIEENG